MAEQICPVCGCAIGVDAYEKEGIKYCCEPCATSAACECGCCTIVEEEQEKQKGKK